MPQTRSPCLTIFHAIAASLFTCALASPVAVAADEIAPDDLAFFEKRIRPVLVEHCYACHSAKAARVGDLEGGLQLDTRAGVAQGGDSGKVVGPGKPEESALIARLTSADKDTMMPPGGRLPESVVTDFSKWISKGAPDPRDGKAVDAAQLTLQAGRNHWAYQRLPEPVSATRDATVDSFVNAKLLERQLLPTPEADKHTLVRRLYFDLIGLPPTPEQTEAFVADSSASAYDDLVDRLLARPQFGERWGRHWLDVARFGESVGNTDELDALNNDAWRYRDAVIRAMNDDMPWDHFVRHQIEAAPEGASQTQRDLGMFLQLGTRLNDNANPNDRQFHILDDMVSTTGQAFLATTVGCARCHDHKIDPITAQEYYQWTAVFFDQAKVIPDAGGKHVPLKLTQAHLLAGGSWQSPVKPVSAGGLRVLMTENENHRESERWFDGAKSDREKFADWMTDVEDGAGALLARVIVNRLWHHHFGRGLVSATNDFGRLSSPPTHPELLDWLAAKLIEERWKLKPIHRLILRSSAWRRSASNDAERIQRDAYNEYLWHRMPRRMESETIRDHLLSVAASLQSEMFGPSIPIGSRKKEFHDVTETWRRSIYLMSPRMDLHPVLKMFDPPDNEFSVGVRGTSTTPASSLFMMNSPFVLEQTKRFADRIVKETADAADLSHKVARIYAIALSRPPGDEELRLGVEFLTPKDESVPPKALLVEYCHAIMGLNEFIYVD